MDLTKLDVFDKYMEGCAMKLLPSVVFDDVEDYIPYSSQFGSFYCGGNVGSMLTNGLTEISFKEKAIIYEKIVGAVTGQMSMLQITMPLIMVVFLAILTVTVIS
jgi:hypothetical protein